MSYFELLWACIHPWFWVGGLGYAISFTLLAHSKKLGYPLAIASIYPYYLGMQQGITKLLQVEGGLTQAVIVLLETMPYIFPAIVFIGFFIFSRGIGRSKNEKILETSKR